jgi:glycosyltransferase involved in cell wall biosynthesis
MLKYWSEAVRGRGYESTTLVNSVLPINRRGDFDRLIPEFAPRLPALRFLRPYVAALWALRTHDVFCFFFEGGVLAHTPLARVELPLLRLAGKRVVAGPYGTDIAVAGHLGPYEEVVLATYPDLRSRAAAIRARVDHVLRWASFVVKNVQPGYLPRWDLYWPTQLAIDTELWAPRGPTASREVVRVVHSPNHRRIKGTDALVAAVDELRAGGAPVELVLCERLPNEEVRRVVADADVVVDQLVCGYGIAAVEAFSAGKPVVTRLSWLAPELRSGRWFRDCPAVDASVENVRERLADLVADGDDRNARAAASREYALRYHSYDAVGGVWDAIFRHVWQGEPLATDDAATLPSAAVT